MIKKTYIGSDGSKLTVRTNEGGVEHYFNSEGQLHRLDGPAVWYPPDEYEDGFRSWYFNGKKVNPLFLVAYWLERGRCCWYDETANELRFGDA